ncbi:MAG: cobalamin biosynthesis protein [Lachnospiraceae bacterium]|nr:cobalamin biosynthesis protein [Lachnospiraceae bacterium]
MNKLAICFHPKGAKLIEKINQKAAERGIDPAKGFYFGSLPVDTEGITVCDRSLAEFVEESFQPGNALIFIGAAGIAVRAVSAAAKDKLSDSPVIVIDDEGRFVIPILSGHAGGGNKLAAVLADLLDAIPVITTATDVNESFSVDSFAAERRLTITDKDRIKQVSLKALSEKKITLSIQDFPPTKPVDVMIADETDREYTLLLRPKRYTVGIGMKKGKDAKETEGFFLECLQRAGIKTEDVYGICTIDLKEEEPAILHLRNKFRIPVISFDAELLKKVTGTFNGSSFVEQTVGVDNVCERAAMAVAGTDAQMVLPKQKQDGITIAIAKMKKTAMYL